MYVSVKSSSGTTLTPIESVHLEKRRVFLRGEIDKDSAAALVDSMLFLNDQSAEPIDLFITSPGGSIASGMLIYDLIQSSRAPIRTFALEAAHSMAAVLFACGRHGRYIMPNSTLMLHEPLIGNMTGNTSSVQSIAESLLENKKHLIELLVLHTGRTHSELEEAIRHDHFFNAEQSIAFGLADEIATFNNLLKG